MADDSHDARRGCGTMEVHEHLMRTVPGYMEARRASEDYAWRASRSPALARTGCTKIPVVVHVVYKTPAQNVSEEQINGQIAVLNADFRLQNADLSTVPAPFKPLAGDARLQFELATLDPQGNTTNGVTRTQTDKSEFRSVDNDIKFKSEGGADAWPRDKYLNIWVGPRILDSNGRGILGYAQFPGGPADTDGVVILHSAFGTTGTAAPPFNLGRTTTHEIGHWLNLRHIWGDDGGGCSGSDLVADTPNQGGPNYGKPTFPSVSCDNGPNGDLFMNYMDYVDDAAMVMFTQGQVSRMHAALDSTRSGIGTSVACTKGPSKDLPKDPPKEFIKEFLKDPPKDFPKDPPKDFPKDPPKDFPKDPPKDFPKDPPKDFPKDPPKDFPKDPPKDFPKDPPKDFPKDPPKDFPKDGPFDPPFGGPFPPIGPGPFVPGGGGVPFVMATPGGVSQPASAGRDSATLATGYLQLMNHYAQLHARGLLDAAGLAVWQQAAAAYAELTQTGSGND